MKVEWHSSKVIHYYLFIMLKETPKQPQITEKIQVGCMWKLIGIFDNRHGHPNKKLLSNAKNEKKHVAGTEGYQRGRDDTNVSENNVVAVDIAEKNVTKLIGKDGEMHKSRQLLDALELLDSNNELFRKLLQDPNSLLVKQIRNTRDLQLEKEPTKSLHENKLPECGIGAIPRKCQKPVHTTDKSFLERIKSQCGCPSTDNEMPCTSDSIVVLKPIQKEHGRDNLGKYRGLESSNRPEIATISDSVLRQKLNTSIVSYSKQRDLEAKKHLSKRLRTVEMGENLSVKQAPRTLRSILSSPLSSPEHDISAIFSPKRDGDPSVSPRMRLSACSNFQLASEHNSLRLENEKVSTCIDYMKPDDQLQNFESEAKILETAYSTDDLSSEASVKIIEVNDAIQSGDLNLSEMPSKQNMSVINAEQITNTTKICKENRYLECSIQDSHMENEALKFSPIVASSNPVSICKVEIEDGSKEREHPSPVSVLEPSFTDDATKLSLAISQSAKPPVQPLRIDFEEDSVIIDPIDSKINLDTCIRTFLQASGQNWDELSKKSHSSGQLRNPSLFDGHNLFSDFIKDVLLELNQRNLECHPWASFSRPDIHAFSLAGKNVIEEIMKEVHWYLVPSAMPRTLEHLIEKDMEKSFIWSGRRLDTEEIVIQIVDYMLVESIMQTIFVIES